MATFLLFNIYAYMIVGGFWAATPLIFHFREFEEIRKAGGPIRWEDWGFNDSHYIWRTIALTVGTASAGFLSGAFSRDSNIWRPLIANVPSALGWAGYAWLIFFFLDDAEGDQQLQNLKATYGYLSIVAIPLTFWLSLKFSKIGCQFQSELNELDSKTLGVSNVHWWWLWIPIGAYLHQILTKTWLLIQLQLSLMRDTGFFAGLVSISGFVTVAIWYAPIIITAQTLRGKYFSSYSKLGKACIIVFVLIGGLIAAYGTSYAYSYILRAYGL